MTDRDFMELAVTEASKSKDESDGRVHPKVGAVVVKDGAVLAMAHRGELSLGDHAEYTVLEKKLKIRNLAGATVFTTLEPCTSRGHGKIPCAKRLLDRRVDRVVIGMLDPNQEIRGRGEWKLAEHNVKIGRFEPDQMASLMDLNRDFIRDQQGLGFEITSHPKAGPMPASPFVVSGKYKNKPRRDEVWVFVRHEHTYWPQERIKIANGKWQCNVTVENKPKFDILVTKVNDDIALWIALYGEVGAKHSDWIGAKMPTLPPGIEVLDEIQVGWQ